MSRSLELLDRHYADALGCAPEDFNSGGLVVVPNDFGCVETGA